jgi:hypothetical protein
LQLDFEGVFGVGGGLDDKGVAGAFIRKSMLELGRGLPFEPKIFLWIMEPCITAFI